MISVDFSNVITAKNVNILIWDNTLLILHYQPLSNSILLKSNFNYRSSSVNDEVVTIYAESYITVILNLF